MIRGNDYNLQSKDQHSYDLDLLLKSVRPVFEDIDPARLNARIIVERLNEMVIRTEKDFLNILKLNLENTIVNSANAALNTARLNGRKDAHM